MAAIRLCMPADAVKLAKAFPELETTTD